MGNLLKLFNVIHDVAVNILWDMRPLQLIKKATGILATEHAWLWIKIADDDEWY